MPATKPCDSTRKAPRSFTMCGFQSRLIWTASIAICTVALLPCRSSGQQAAQVDDSLRQFGSPCATSRQPPPIVTAIAISSDGSVLATAGDDALVNLWKIDDGRLMFTLRGHTEWVRAVAFSPDGKAVASAGDDRTIRIWDSGTGELILRNRTHGSGDLRNSISSRRQIHRCRRLRSQRALVRL